MSESYEKGQRLARAVIAKFKEFDKTGMNLVTEDLRQRRLGRRRFMVTSASKVRFVVGIAPMLLRGGIEITNDDYARLCGLTRSSWDQLVKDDSSIGRELAGFENKEHWGPRTHGPSARLVSCMLRDMSFREAAAKDPNFREGFVDEFAGLVAEEEIVISRNLQEFSTQLKKAYGSRALLEGFKKYERLMNDTVSNIETFRRERLNSGTPGYDPQLNHVIWQNEKTVIASLGRIRDGTLSAVHDSRRGRFSSRLSRSIIQAATQDDYAEFWPLWSDFLLITGMLYFLSAWSSNEFAKNADAFDLEPDSVVDGANSVRS